MTVLRQELTRLVSAAFATCGYDPQFGDVTRSDRPDLGQFQCNGAMAAAKAHKANPRQIAERVVDVLRAAEILRDVSLAGPGFINLSLTDEALAAHVDGMSRDERLGYVPIGDPVNVVVDYGGPNVAKPMHVGHLRAAIIGESIKRVARFVGHHVVGDVHLGDWGLQMGMLISELQHRQPALPYFDANFTGPYPSESPVSIRDLEDLYPAANRRAQEDAAAMDAARQATFELQQGRAGYRALWQHFVDVSVAELKADYARLGVSFDLWLGESHTQDRIPPLIDRLRAGGFAEESAGALIIDVTEPDDKAELAPLMLVKSDGAVLYGTTDLATIEQRVEELKADLVIYVVDNRQSSHFQQVFRGAYKCRVAPPAVGLEHAGFGTMNGKDGKPFKTRAGGVMRLKDLIDLVTEKAFERMAEIKVAQEYEETERSTIAEMVGLAALKYADLMNHRTRDYVFDLDRFSSFEGRTGPYILYSAVRTRSILRKATDLGLTPGTVLPPASELERDVCLQLTGFPDVVDLAFQHRAPNYIADYAYALAGSFNRFYHEHHILREGDAERQASWLHLASLSVRALDLAFELLGIRMPERM